MFSTAPTPSRSNDDLTARARIRDVAMDRFPRDGLEGTTIRSIASEAGVSAALVLHHYGSKEGLRRGCDEHVVELFRTTKREAMESGNFGNPGFLDTAYNLAPSMLRYLAWALATGSDTAGQLFDEMLEESLTVAAMAEEAGFLRPVSDRPRVMAVLMAMQLGGVVLHDHLSRALGVDTLTKEGVLAVSKASIEIFTHGIFTEEAGAMAAAAIEAMTPPTTEGT